ncbi:LPXTG cell wall anchor domain-containing protein [Streptomyces lydicus]|nr:LPXTG cell wall anchor domain-containing protein [Streptomyces lydicus]
MSTGRTGSWRPSTATPRRGSGRPSTTPCPRTCSASSPSVRTAASRSNCAPTRSRTPSPAPGTRSPPATTATTTVPVVRPRKPGTTSPSCARARSRRSPRPTSRVSRVARPGPARAPRPGAVRVVPVPPVASARRAAAKLAATGASSALPSIALAGGAAMVAGAGAVIGVRRRKSMAGPGATDVTA